MILHFLIWKSTTFFKQSICWKSCFFLSVSESSDLSCVRGRSNISALLRHSADGRLSETELVMYPRNSASILLVLRLKADKILNHLPASSRSIRSASCLLRDFSLPLSLSLDLNLYIRDTWLAPSLGLWFLRAFKEVDHLLSDWSVGEFPFLTTDVRLFCVSCVWIVVFNGMWVAWKTNQNCKAGSNFVLHRNKWN